MPNRILRDCTDSWKINLLDVHAERFFYRLIMIVDDYGRFHAHPGLLRAKVFPLQVDKVREADITRWMAACQKAGLISLYEVRGSRYFQVLDFRQRLDKAREKYPPPDSGNSISTDNDFPAETKRNESETNPNPNPNPKSEKTGEFFLINPFSENFLIYWQKWKKYKKKQHRFTFADVEYEQQSINSLAEISKKDEAQAAKIIDHAIAQGWKGLFEITKSKLNGINQKQHSATAIISPGKHPGTF